MDYTFWSPHFNALVLWKATDRILASHAAETAVDAGSDDDAQFAADMADIYMLRARIIAANPTPIARNVAHIDRQTRDALCIDPKRRWPDDHAAALIAAWKATA